MLGCEGEEVVMGYPSLPLFKIDIMAKIRSITEAFSMQPSTQEVRLTREPFEKDKSILTKIWLEQRTIRGAGEVDFYVGYDQKGRKLFEYLRSSVNVHYFIEE